MLADTLEHTLPGFGRETRIYPTEEGAIEKLMARIRTKIAASGLNDAEVAEGMPHFRQYLRERPWLIEPKAEWDPQESRLLVTIETEGADPKLESEGVFDEVWDCVIAAFRFSSERIAFSILGAQPVERTNQ